MLKFKKVLIFYNIYQPIYDQLLSITSNRGNRAVRGLPINDISDADLIDAVVFVDDLTHTLDKTQQRWLEEVHCVKSHHLPVTLIVTYQNLNPKNATLTTIIRNVSHIVLFNSRQNFSILVTLQKTLYPQMAGLLIEVARICFERDANKYLWIDCKAAEQHSLKANVLEAIEGQSPMIIYSF